MKDCVRVSTILKWWEDQQKTAFVSIRHQEAYERKGRIGTSVHQAIQDESAGYFPILTMDDLPYFESFEKWRKNVSPKIMVSERRFYDLDLKITGRIDALVQIPGSLDHILVDYKTSASPMPSWIYQGHLYWHLLNKNKMNPSKTFIFLQLKKDGKEAQAHQFHISDSYLRNSLAIVNSYFSAVSLAKCSKS